MTIVTLRKRPICRIVEEVGAQYRPGMVGDLRLLRVLTLATWDVFPAYRGKGYTSVFLVLGSCTGEQTLCRPPIEMSSGGCVSENWATLVLAAGAILAALSIAAMLYQAFGDPDYETYDWPVYAVLTIASVALMWKGVRDWQKL